MAPGKYTPFMKEMDGLRDKLHNVPKVDPRTHPRTRLPILQQLIARTPAGLGGSAFVHPVSARGSASALSGVALVRAAMAVHRARHAEKLAAKTKADREAGDSLPTDDIAAVYYDERCVVVPDKFPKSAFHFLVMPRAYNRLTSLNDLTSEVDLPLMKHMVDVGTTISKAIQESNCDAAEITNPEHVETHATIFTPGEQTENERAQTARLWADVNKDSLFNREAMLHRELPANVFTLPRTRVKFVHGFHALPSLAPLHMHVVSLDLLSPTLKSKKHYNSFTTNFFLSADGVERELAERGTVRANQRYHEFEFLERKQMECVWCGLVCEQVPKLRRHLPVCPKNKAWL